MLLYEITTTAHQFQRNHFISAPSGIKLCYCINVILNKPSVWLLNKPSVVWFLNKIRRKRKALEWFKFCVWFSSCQFNWIVFFFFFGFSVCVYFVYTFHRIWWMRMNESTASNPFGIYLFRIEARAATVPPYTSTSSSFFLCSYFCYICIHIAIYSSTSIVNICHKVEMEIKVHIPHTHTKPIVSSQNRKSLTYEAI